MNPDMRLKISRLASKDPFYLGWHFARYLELKGANAVDLSNELGCLPDTINSMSLCRSPRKPPRFREDIERVADRFQVKADKLMDVVRLSQVASDEQALLAARYREETEDEDSRTDE